MHQYSQGISTKQAHKAIPEGCFEEEQGLKGFFGPVSHLIKKDPSTRWEIIDGPLKPRMFDLVPKFSQVGEQRLLFNKDVSIGLKVVPVSANNSKTAYRNADGDQLYFCHLGCGVILTEYGLLPYSEGQYVVIPKCLTHSIVPTEASQFLTVENRTSHYEEPDRGLVGRHAIYDTAALGKPNLEKMQEFLNAQSNETIEIRVKRLDQITRFEYDRSIYDTVGWKGDLFPFTLHTDDMMPLMSHRAHLPPSAHTTFVAREFVICTFLPRPLESDEDALKVPFYHQNIDYDEVLFYHKGDFFSRDNLHAGMMSLHPAGFPHGPHPKAVKSIKGKTHTSEYAVMIDTRWPLEVDPSSQSLELADYWKSWQSK
ncbi:MAG: homogentisate 1,2-dioxygenase [Bdellovibrionales bacterium]|nr:homogentisate 1,2-dioxygenase [Bdellovibrionales bacterium]